MAKRPATLAEPVPALDLSDIEALIDHIDSLSDEELAALDHETALAAVAALKAHVEAWQPTEKQEIAQQIADTAFETLYGGAAGGGKSEWLLRRAWDKSVKIPKHRTIIFRRTYPELLDSLIARSLDIYDHTAASYKVGEHTWAFPNGSIIRFAHLQEENDKYKYQSSQWHMVGFDELTHFTETQYRYMFSRCRATKADVKRGARPHVVAGSNPGGVGHDWVKLRFIDPAPWGTIFESASGRRTTTRAFVPARLADNPYLDEDYEDRLYELSEVERRQLLDGDWDAFEGRFFPEFTRESHVIEPFEIPAWWPRERGLDHGFTNPWAVVWGAWSPDGELVIYRESYERNKTPGQQVDILNAQLDRDATGKVVEQIGLTYSDPAIWGKGTGVGEPVAIMYHRRGLAVVPAMNARVSGWNAVRERMSVVIDDDGNRHTKLLIFSTCVNLIRTLASLPRDDRNPEDANSKAEDHLPDALRYLCMTSGRRGREPRRDPDGAVDKIYARHDHSRRRRHLHPTLGRLP